MQITRSSIDTHKGPADWFTGEVYIDAVAGNPVTCGEHVTDEQYVGGRSA